MSLDINTPKGQKSLHYEKLMLDYIELSWGIKIIHTNKKDSAICDGILVKNNTIVSIFESKCRDLSYEEIEDMGSWLITYDKIKGCQKISEYLKVPFIGFLFLIKSNITMFWKITDSKG